MEFVGVALDVDYLAAMSKELERQIDNLIRDIYRHAGGQFNINSTQQLGTILFDKLGLKSVRRTQTGHSTDASVLEALRPFHEAPDLLLQHRTLSKLIGSYLKTLPDFIHAGTGRIHTHLRQTGTAHARKREALERVLIGFSSEG